MSAERRHGDPPVKKSKEAIVVQIGRATIFGVHHDAKLPGGFRMQQLKDNFKMTDHLLMEGDTDMLGTMNTRNPQNYEALAVSVFNYRNMRENVHWLEQGADFRSLAEQYGMDPRVFMSFMDSGSINEVVDRFMRQKFPKGKGLEEYGRDLAARIKFKAARTSPITEDDIFEAIDKNAKSRIYEITILGEDPRNMIEDTRIADDEIMKYLGEVRDFEVMGPRVAELATELPGKLAVVVGKFHIPAMKAALRGLPIKRPLSWDEHKEKLDLEVQEAVVVFEKLAKRKIT
ncbi:MAG TPA: hypothetical protein VM077_00155 [Candidatus Limnocylindrales bacterium]|nr:hypothetical protein [Candidatus Limnocylindrales bacterium]